MQPRLISIRYVGGHRLELHFDDGLNSEMDFIGEIGGQSGLWEQLRDQTYFQRAFVDSETGVLTWPNGVDYCPDVLYSLASGKPIGWADENPTNPPVTPKSRQVRAG